MKQRYTGVSDRLKHNLPDRRLAMARLMAMAFVIFALLSFNSAHAKYTTNSAHVKQTHIKHTKSAHVKQTKNSNNLIYDAALNITWYNPIVDPMTWDEAISWITNLNNEMIGGVTGWRLPSIVNGAGGNPISTLDIAFSEMERLYLELGNLTGGPLTNTGPFSYLEPLNYWSSAEDPNAITLRALAFNFGSGKHGYGNKIDGTSFAVLAVHSGNVGVTQIPEPGILLLLGPGLAGLAIMRKKIIKKTQRASR